MHTSTKTIAAASAVAVLMMLTGCSASSADTGSPSHSTGDAATTATGPSTKPSSKATKSVESGGAAVITIKDFAFSGTDSVAPGAKITVTNDDTETHTVTSDDGSSFDVTVPAGSSATLTAPSAAGTYTYHCSFHSNMSGTLTVS